MYMDVTDLGEFYRSPMGSMVRRLLVHRLRARWRDVRGLSVMGLGYASPYLGAFAHEAQRLGALMPAAQGAHLWPANGPMRTVLVEDHALPLPDHSVDRLLAVHAIEMCDGARAVLREIWRVLTPEGRLLLIVPNRHGAWARRDTTPFGHGQPYSRGQIERLLTSAMFSIESCSFALVAPPIRSAMLWRNVTALERLGGRLALGFSGVILVEARKEVFGGLPKAETAAARSRFRILAPDPAPQARRSHYQRLPGEADRSTATPGDRSVPRTSAPGRLVPARSPR